MHLQFNMFNMKRMIFVSLSWHMLYMMPYNMFRKSKFTRDLNHLYPVNYLIIWIGSSFPIKLWHIFLGTRVSSVVVMIFFNGKKRIIWYFNAISDYVTLVQLIYTSDNVNHSVIINGRCIYDSNYKPTLTLIK